MVVQNTNRGTTTDFDGNYQIQATQGETLAFSYVGYASQNIAVGSQATINVQMQTARLLEEVVITEKYKSLYGNAPVEAWVDYRRTGYPELTPNPDAVPSLNPSGIIPRRFLYPISERITNEVNYEAAISGQGGHLQDDDLWAFPK